MRAIAEEASALVRNYKGAFSGEHGDGLCRGEWIEWQFGPLINDAFRSIKDVLDPNGLFNPGKIVDPPKMDDGALFRFPPPQAPAPYRTIALVPVLDWSAWDVQNDPRTEAITRAGHAAATRPAASPRRSRCATTTATAASSTPARCARAFARRATSST